MERYEKGKEIGQIIKESRVEHSLFIFHWINTQQRLKNRYFLLFVIESMMFILYSDTHVNDSILYTKPVDLKTNEQWKHWTYTYNNGAHDGYTIERNQSLDHCCIYTKHDEWKYKTHKGN